MQLYTSIRNEFLDIRMKIRCKMTAELKKQEVKFSPIEHRMLVKIKDADNTSQQLLAESMKRDKAQIARMVDRLHKQELINKEKDPEDKRSVKLTMTTRGKKLLTRLDDLEMEFIKEMLFDFSEEEKKLFCSFLIRANKSLI